MGLQLAKSNPCEHRASFDLEIFCGLIRREPFRHPTDQRLRQSISVVLNTESTSGCHTNRSCGSNRIPMLSVSAKTAAESRSSLPSTSQRAVGSYTTFFKHPRQRSETHNCRSHLAFIPALFPASVPGQCCFVTSDSRPYCRRASSHSPSRSDLSTSASRLLISACSSGVSLSVPHASFIQRVFLPKGPDLKESMNSACALSQRSRSCLPSSSS